MLFALEILEVPKSASLIFVLVTADLCFEDSEIQNQAQSVTIRLQLGYPAAEFLNLGFSTLDGIHEDSADHESLEAFVKAIFSNDVFVRLALLKSSQAKFIDS